MPPIAITPRLIIRSFQPDEEETYVQLLGDVRVNQHLPVRTPDENRKIFQSTLKDDADGAIFSKWAIINKTGNNFIGMCLLRTYNNEPAMLEAGYCLHAQYWGRGIATEMMHALVAYASRYPQIKSVVAVTTPNNAASQAVLLKAGLTRQGSIVKNNEELIFFQREL